MKNGFDHVIPIPIDWLLQLLECSVFFHLLKDFCKELKNLPDHQIRNLRIRRNAVSGEPEIQCFMERLNEYLQVSKKKKRLLYLNHNWEIPTNNNSTEEDQCLKKASHFTGQLSCEIIDKKIHKQATIDVLCRTTFQIWLFFTQKSRDIANFCDSVTKFGYAVTEVFLG